jgi:hypothetical protein
MEGRSIGRFLDIRVDGRFQLRQRLGAGTFGVVYLGRQSCECRLIADYRAGRT